MARNISLILLCFAFAVLWVHAAEPKPDAEAKARAAMQAAAVGKAYETELGRFGEALKDNRLDDASAAANAMIKLSAEPGDPPWQPTIRTIWNVLRQFEQKKVFGARYTRSLYEDAIRTAAADDDRAEWTLQYGLFLHRYALLDDKAALDIVESAFNLPGVSTRKRIQLCYKMAEYDPAAHLDLYAQRALAYAKDDPAARVVVYSWLIAGYGRTGRHEEILPLYEKLLADSVYQSHRTKIGMDMVSYLINTKQFSKAIDYLGRTISTLQGQDKLAHQRLLAEAYKRSSPRFFSAPDKQDLQLAIGVYREIINALPPEKSLDVADTQVLIAELACAAGDYATASAEASHALACRELAEKRPGTKPKAEFILAQIAYAQEEYAKAVAILIPLHRTMQEKPGHYPFKRDVLEMLVRGHCAIGDYTKALAYSDELLQSVRSFEKARYQAYVDGLKQR